jgi:hemerythrin-like domain-containing protein
MLPTEELKEEHEAVLSVLEILQTISQKIISGQVIEVQHLNQLLTILKEFVDYSHHGKEEKILFTALEKLGFPKEGGPVGVMLSEHDNGRQYIQGMRDAVALIKAGEPEGPRKFATNASYYCSLMVDHIHKENNVLYPMADMHLTADDKNAMLEDFKQVEADAIGLGNKNKYLEQIKELRAIYS